MRAVTIAAAVVLLGATGLARAGDNDRYNGKYLVSGSKHMAPASKRNRNAPQFNPKEISVEKPVPWQKTTKNSSRHIKSKSGHILD